MRFTDIFIRRPVLATCVSVLILFAGLASIRELNVRQYPRSETAVVKIETAYVGADADLVRGFITTPLERVVASADGIDYLESSSILGLSTITAHLRLNFDVNAALTQIQAKVNQVRNDLPPEAEAPVIRVESADSRFASMYLSFYSEALEQNQITDYLLRVVQPKLSSVPGVERADILGERTFAMRIWLKPERLAALNLSPSEVERALRSNNFLSAVGQTKGELITVNLVTNTDLQTREEFEQLVVRNDGNAVVYLRDIADVQLGAENYDAEVRFSGETAVFMGIWVLPNANSLDVIARVRVALDELRDVLPEGMKFGIPYDATAYIRDALREVVTTLIETVAIVILVIFLFIGSLRSVLVPIVAIPLSLIGAVALMLLFGFTINLLTLLATVLAVGLVVDDAIVMLENVERHVREGLSPLTAAFVAARELATPIMAMTVTLAAVYTPIAFQGGLTGALFKEFALTLAGAVFISGVVALTLSPMMASRLVRREEKPSRLKVWVETNFDRLREQYRTLLVATLAVRPGVLSAAAVLGILVLPLYLFSTKELAPREDQGVVFGIVQAAPNAAIDETVRFTEQTQKVFEALPEYAQSFQITTPTGGFSGALLKPWSERRRSSVEISEVLWGDMSVVPGIRVIVITPPPLPGGSDFPVELVISSTREPRQLLQYAEQLVGAAFQSGMFMYADTDLKFDVPQSEIIFDREKLGLLGLTLESVGNDLGVMFGGNFVNRFNIAGRSYKVIPQLARRERLTPNQLEEIYVSGPDGQLVPVATFAALKQGVQPRSLNRFQQLNSAKIQGAIPPGVSIDQGLQVLERKAREILPRDFQLDYAGESRQLRREGSALVTTLLMAIVVIFLVLAAQFESFRDPFIILLGSVPLALAGALLFTFLGFTTLNIYSQIGLVTLVGLVAKNGILIVEFANQLQERGRSLMEATVEAAVTRLRPVLMTSVATVVGHFPLLLASGPGAGARNSIGAVLVTGMFIGTFFTLFVVPCIYRVVSSSREKLVEPPPLDSVEYAPPKELGGVA